ncbi:MAG: hypothetical protein V8T87_05930 [Victivallales bacterium]
MRFATSSDVHVSTASENLSKRFCQEVSPEISFPNFRSCSRFLSSRHSFPVRLGVFQKLDFVHRAFEVHPFVVESRQTPADHHRRTGFDRTEIFRF